MLSRILLATCLLPVLLAPAEAQRRDGRGMEPKLEPFAADGTIEAVGRGRIQILTATDQKWLLGIGPEAKIHVTGTAELDFLRPGLFVQLTGEFDKRGKGKEKIDKLMIFTPSQQVMVGIWPEGAAPVDGAEDHFGDMVPNAGAAKPAASNRYTVHGQITSVRKRKLKVNGGRGIVQFELAEEPAIDVDFADYSVAQKGDKISVIRGKMYAGRMGMAQATDLKIELSEPLTTKKKKKKKPVRTKKSTSKRSSQESEQEKSEETLKEEEEEEEEEEAP